MDDIQRIEKRLDAIQRDMNSTTRLLSQISNRQIKLENKVSAQSRRIGRTGELRGELATIRQQVATLSELTDNVTRQVHQAVVQLAPPEARDNVTNIKRGM